MTGRLLIVAGLVFVLIGARNYFGEVNYTWTPSSIQTFTYEFGWPQTYYVRYGGMWNGQEHLQFRDSILWPRFLAQPPTEIGEYPPAKRYILFNILLASVIVTLTVIAAAFTGLQMRLRTMLAAPIWVAACANTLRFSMSPVVVVLDWLIYTTIVVSLFAIMRNFRRITIAVN